MRSLPNFNSNGDQLNSIARGKLDPNSPEAGTPLRVLHIITRMIVGGAQENTLLTVEGLNRLNGYQATLLSGVDYGPEGEMLSRARATVPLIVVPELYRRISPVDDAIALTKLRKIIRQGRYHIVHTHSSKAGVLGRIAARLAGTPLIIHTIHGMAFHEYQPWIANRTWKLVEKLAAKVTDHFISVSAAMSRKMIAAGIGNADDHSKIFSGMELDWFLHPRTDPRAVRKELGIPPDALVVGKIARLFPLKGHDTLLGAAPIVLAERPNTRFLLIGDGILRKQLQDRARQLGMIDRFIFAGLVDRLRIPEMISVMDVLVHTSVREGLARALPQALAMGKPCVSLDLDGAPEVIIPGETGFLVRPGDFAGLAKSIMRLLSDSGLRKRMGEAGRRIVDPAFRAETMVREISTLYQRLVALHPERLARFRSWHA